MSRILMTWVSRSHNTKTGPVIGAYCGQSIAEMAVTCLGCILREVVCYAWGGTPRLGFGAMAKAATGGKTHLSVKGTDAVKPGGRYSLKYALAHMHKKCRAARIGTLGDCSRVWRPHYLKAVATLRKAGLVVLNYTHFWWDPANAELKDSAMGSCNSFREVPTCIDAGFVPAAIWKGMHKDTPNLPHGVKTPTGEELLVCLHNRCGIQCNLCCLCDPAHRFWKQQSRFVGIALCEH